MLSLCYIVTPEDGYFYFLKNPLNLLIIVSESLTEFTLDIRQMSGTWSAKLYLQKIQKFFLKVNILSISQQKLI